MMTFIKDFFTRQKGKKAYRSIALKAVRDGHLDSKEKNDLQNIAKEFLLKPADILPLQREAYQAFYNKILEDGRISEEEQKNLNDLIASFCVTKEQIDFNQELFNKHRTLGMIQEGKLPVLNDTLTGMPPKKGEVFHYIMAAAKVKKKNVTQKINYKGLTSSIRIAKGIYYRAGSISTQTITKEIIAKEDIGFFWITNQRIGFIGSNKNFSFPIEKLLAFELEDGLVKIMKEGRENGFLLLVTEYEVPFSIVSFLINKTNQEAA